MQFQRGPYGEILLAPLLADLPTVLQALAGEEIYKKMAPAEREALYDELLSASHRQNLQRALLGEELDEPKAVAL